MENFDVIIYHGPCYDGFTAAWVARQRFPGAVMHQATHGDPPPDVAGKTVLIADFCYPAPVMRGMLVEAAHITVLDHHKTSEADMAALVAEGHPNLTLVFDMNRSGAGITWDHLNPGVARPAIVHLVEDRDLWRLADPRTRAHHAAMTLYPMTFSAWDEISSLPMPELLDAGNVVLDFTTKIAETFASRAVRMRLPWSHGYQEVWCVNVPVEFVTETGEAVSRLDPQLPMLGWSWDGTRQNYYCSLRSVGIDISPIAKVYGGGGHANASGFRSTLAPPQLGYLLAKPPEGAGC